MASANKSTIWDMAPHTKAKHDILKNYLNAWFPILGTQRRRIVFLDGFAGPGIYATGEHGSPVLALNTLLQHSHFPRMSACEFVFLFNEADKERFKTLENVVEQLRTQSNFPANVQIGIQNGLFSAMASEMLGHLKDQKKTLAPTFAFIDPFGYSDISMLQLSELLSFSSCELFIYFDFNSASRFSQVPAVRDSFERLYGTKDFLLAPAAGDPERGEFLRALYERQLKSVANFPYVRDFQMIKENGKTNNYLFYCTRSLKGLSTMKDAMWKVDPSGEYRFSDQFAGRNVLFGDEPDLTILQDDLLKTFSGQTVSVETLEAHVVLNTPFRAGHLKKGALKVLEYSNNINCSNRRRNGTYPSGTLIHFPAAT